MSTQTHPHPNRHRKALKRAIALAVAGLIVWIIGVVAIFVDSGFNLGVVVGLVVVGITMILLSPVWYFSYMENLEPELYHHDK